MMPRRMLLSFLILACVGVALAQNGGTLTVTSQPSNCWVRIDSVLVGRTPIESFELSPGEHLVQVYPPQTGLWNLQEHVSRVIIHSGQEVRVHARFSTPVLINSVPYGAELFQDTTRLGLTPLYVPFEEYRGKLFRLVKEGYRPYEFRLTERKPLLARLQKAEPEAVSSPSRGKLLGFISRRNLKSKFSLLALTVATHWASFYFKNVADSNFDKYKRTADPHLRQRYWDNTRKYDRFSAIALGASFVSLGGLIYMVIWK